MNIYPRGMVIKKKEKITTPQARFEYILKLLSQTIGYRVCQQPVIEYNRNTVIILQKESLGDKK